ncbi:type I secretion system permease/ATPase [Amphritea opalescens]|uniref:Type I secretion system permease/ATPase n=1 Tax=Amphritea opalescens TaxID=2490544 RepID=A0A430KLG2_9GAMM|nr:type I secretion system permease/ATPase [Amphritea opalescens]RTE64274.1 type I secretion system permease/ATPase [Amphritea opalescens]
MEQSESDWVFGTSREQFVDPLLDALVLLSKYYGTPASEDSLSSGLPLVDNRLTLALFPRAAERAGLSARLADQSLSEIHELLLPCVLLLHNHGSCILMSINHEAGTARILQSESGDGEVELSLAALEKIYSGHLFYIRKKYQFDQRSPDVLDTQEGHWFWSTFRSAVPIYRDVLIASLLINLFAVASPLFVMNVYDRIVPNLAFDSLWVLAIGVGLVFVFDLILKHLRSYFIDVAGKKLDLQLSAKIFARVMGIRLEARPLSVGAFANNLQSFEMIREFITSATLGALIDLPFALLFLLVIWIVGGPLALVPLTVMIILIGYSLYIQKPLARQIEITSKIASQKQATLVEGLTGIEAVKINGAQSQYQVVWEQAVSKMGQHDIQTRKLANGASSLSGFLQQMMTVGIVVLGVYLVAAGDLSMGGIIASVMLAGRAVQPLAQLSLLATRYNQAKASMSLINQVMEMPVEEEEGKSYVSRPKLQGKIEFDKVCFSYPGQQRYALQDVSFTIQPGERVALIGGIGAGKSSLEKLILGLYQCTQGDVRIDGVNIAQLHPADLRRNVGAIMQENHLFFGSIRDNIVMGAPFTSDENLLRAAEWGGVTAFTNNDPEGLERQVGEGGRQLSGGQRQSVAAARAIVMDPPIMLLDEPSSHLDRKSEVRLMNQLKALDRSKTVILSTHKSSLLDVVDRIIVLENGRLIADGPKAEVINWLRDGVSQQKAKQEGKS